LILDKFELIRLLGDGRFHSGQALASQLRVSRGAIWKSLKKFERELGLEIQSVRGRGYRLDTAIEFLDANTVKAALSSDIHSQLDQVEVHTSLDSTNRYLYELARNAAQCGHVVIAEHQQAGRGRRGRNWVSPFAQNIYLSLLWRFDFALPRLAGLSLAVAVAVARALHRLTDIEPQLKWPNDILFQGRKLAGNLLEVQGESDGPCAAVIGIGINVSMPEAAAKEIDQVWIDLNHAAGKTISRNILCAAILNELVAALQAFTESGLKSFLADWQRWDGIAGQPVRLIFSDSEIEGVVQGIDEQGALLLRNKNGLRRYQIGEVSLRGLNDSIGGLKVAQ